ncbi:MAG: hypothetical protein H7A24_15315 [Leptospiraceae bacterium]|nr:hypothetical protein [Leptospiraceae bacterium]MCP5513255.1 hypothetical protein [Leptospiraceae bacterium]
MLDRLRRCFQSESIFFKAILFIFVFLVINCTNYSVSKTQTVPPILISLSARTGGGHLLVFRGTNPEFFFVGYKLYVSNSVNSARNPSSLTGGVDCENRGIIPNLPLEYSIEIYADSVGLSPVNTGENGNRICKFPVNLSSGSVIAVRSLLLSIQPGSQVYQFSTPSNALVVP